MQRFGYVCDRHSEGANRNERTAVSAGLCDVHLKHVLDDGTKPTDSRYCVNSVALATDREEIVILSIIRGSAGTEAGN